METHWKGEPLRARSRLSFWPIRDCVRRRSFAPDQSEVVWAERLLLLTNQRLFKEKGCCYWTIRDCLRRSAFTSNQSEVVRGEWLMLLANQWMFKANGWCSWPIRGCVRRLASDCPRCRWPWRWLGGSSPWPRPSPGLWSCGCPTCCSAALAHLQWDEIS